jgi:hypothetical protein
VSEVLTVCPDGWLDCDQPEHSATVAYTPFLSRNPTFDPNDTGVDLVRRLLVSAEPYRSTVEPSNSCLELVAPKNRSALVEHFLEYYGGSSRARYLEIGCEEDATFSRVRSLSASAIGVDPKSGGTHRRLPTTFSPRPLLTPPALST